MLPGAALALAAAAAAAGIHVIAPALSASLVAIVFGILATNLTSRRGGVPPRFSPGLDYAGRTLLRLGVVLLGLQLLLSDILALGWRTLAGLVLVVGGTFLGTVALGRRWRIDTDQTLLIAGGFSICGAAAVGGVESVLRRGSREKAAAAVALVVAFGTLMIVLMPLLVALVGLDPTAAGTWIGASVHEVAQVVAAGSMVSPDALRVAVVVKLARVLLLTPVLALLALRERRQDRSLEGQRPPLVPGFVVAFAAMVALRSLVTLPAPVLEVASQLQAWALTAAMFALGTNVHVAHLRSLGLRPVALAASATVLVTALGAATALLAGR